MAGFLDVSLLSNLSFVFAFVLVWTVVYSILSFTEIFKMPNNIRALVAMVLAFLTLLSPPVIKLIGFIVPWFTLFFIGITFILLGLMIFGIKQEDITKFVKTTPGPDSYNTVQLWVIIISILIVVGGIGAVFFSGGVGTATSTPSNGVISAGNATGGVGAVGPGALEAIIFHPKVLGLLFIMLLGVFACVQLAK